jgi:hypothetical protein
MASGHKRTGVGRMRYRVCRLPVVLTGAALAVALGASQVQAAASAASAGWRRAFLSHAGQSNLLLGVAASGRNDAWAVGEYVQQPGPLIMHWNGRRWRPVQVPGAGRAFEPVSVYATGPGDVWILGSIWRNGLEEALHFDGSAWHSIPLPTGTIGANETAVLSPSSVWAISAGICPYRCSTPASYWDGSDWSVSQVHLDLWAITAAGKHVYALAVSGYRAQDQAFMPVLYERSQGRWLRRGQVRTRLSNPVLAASSASDVWIWGHPAGRAGRAGRGMLYHWNGVSLSNVAVPARLFTNDGLTADGHGGVWAGPYAHWTGSRWVSLGADVAQFNGLSTALAPVPGTRSTWLVGGLAWHKLDEGFVAVNGAMP